MSSKFQLVHMPHKVPEARARVQSKKSAAPAAPKAAPGKKKLGMSGGLESAPGASAVPSGGVSRARAPRKTVGLWSLGGWLDTLPELIVGLNRAQKTFTFYQVEAPIPAGLISRRERTIAWVTERRGVKPTASEKQEIGDNIVADDFFPVGEQIRRDFDLDYLIGITPARVAWDDDESVYWNYFSTFEKKTIMVSTTDLRTYAEDIGARFEAFLTLLIVDQLYVATFHASKNLGYHANTGCIFDEDIDRETIKEKIIHSKIDDECRMTIPPAYRPAMDAFIKFIKTSSGLK